MYIYAIPDNIYYVKLYTNKIDSLLTLYLKKYLYAIYFDAIFFINLLKILKYQLVDNFSISIKFFCKFKILIT